MNLLQSIDEKVHGPVLVTLNPPFEPKKELVLGEWSYDHPLYSDTVRLDQFDTSSTDKSRLERGLPGAPPHDPEQAWPHILRRLDRLRIRESPRLICSLLTNSTARGRLLLWSSYRRKLPVGQGALRDQVRRTHLPRDDVRLCAATRPCLARHWPSPT